MTARRVATRRDRVRAWAQFYNWLVRVKRLTAVYERGLVTRQQWYEIAGVEPRTDD